MTINNANVEQINIALLDIDKRIKALNADSETLKSLQDSVKLIKSSLNETKAGLTGGATYNINISGNAATATQATNAISAIRASTAESADEAGHAIIADTADSAKTADTASNVPTKTSDLQNDSGFSSVEANPTLSGGENNLTSIDINGTKYKVPAANDWTLVSGGTSTQKALPSDWRELLIVAYLLYENENICYQFYVTREMVKGIVHRFYSGYTYTTSDYGGARVDVTETTATLKWFKYEGALQNASMTVRYK